MSQRRQVWLNLTTAIGAAVDDTLQKRIDQIQTKLSLVRQQDLSCFGSGSHRFRMNKLAEESELALFESKYGVALPACYRGFLLRIGNGGAGPYYGIYRLERWDEVLESVGDESPLNNWGHHDWKSGFLKLPCPLHPDMKRVDDWEDQFSQVVSPYQGMITIGTQGCSYMMGLIITGDYSGRVVYLAGDGGPPYVVRETDFLAWYERWLDELIAGYDMDWFGFGLGGSESTLVALLDSSEASPADSVDALNAIRRMPDLSPSGQDTIRRFLSHDNTNVRAAACTVIAEFRIAAAENALQELLRDESVDVQRAAIRANATVRGASAHDEITPLLRSHDSGVAEQAFESLSGQSPLPREMSLDLLKSSPHPRVRAAAAGAIEWTSDDVDLLIHLLKHDTDWQVRQYASTAFREFATMFWDEE